MVMIRRELPRTRDAGRGRRAPRRIKQLRILLFAATPTAVCTPPYVLRGRGERRLPLDRPGNVPDEAEELAAHRRDHLVVVLSPRGQGSIPVMQALLGPPGDLGERRVEPGLACP